MRIIAYMGGREGGREREGERSSIFAKVFLGKLGLSRMACPRLSRAHVQLQPPKVSFAAMPGSGLSRISRDFLVILG